VVAEGQQHQAGQAFFVQAEFRADDGLMRSTS
jgi:hypothetical protein